MSKGAEETPRSLNNYWLDEHEFEKARELLSRKGFKLVGTLLTPCRVLVLPIVEE